MSRLAGKTALITGGSNGIGRAAALLFAAQGARVGIADIDATNGPAVVAQIVERGGDAAFFPVDVCKEDNVRATVADFVTTFGRIDILYNNAGASLPGDGLVTEADSAIFWRSIELNVFSVWAFCKHAIPEIIRNGGGSVINTTSVAGLMGLANIDAYTAAKGAVAAITRSMAVEFAPHKVRVNAIAPTQTMTERATKLNNSRLDTGTHSAAQTRNLLGPAMPEDVAHAALYLASDEACRTTGQIIRVDSGLTIS
jgi:NAD(P)-dependent dehydrogenase (short-subunit alcohol dehydrogenase family)